MGNTNSTDVSIDTENGKEMMTGSHITEFHIHKHKEPVTTESLIKVLNVPEVFGAIQKYQLDLLNKSKNSNILSKSNNVTHK